MKNTLALIAFLAVCFAAAAVGGLFTAGSVDGWYQTLAKPSFTPPDWVFGPMWTLLYAMMAVAAWCVWRRAGLQHARLALGLFIAQLALNVTWSALFFGLRSPGLGLVDIVLLWVAIVLTIVAFRRQSMLAAALMLPYLLWVSFAGVLNFAIWQLNR